MLTDEEIEKLIRPFVERQQVIDSYVINQIAKKIKEVGELSPKDVYRLTRLFKNGSDVRAINKQIAKMADVQEKAVKKMVKEVAVNTYADAKPFYDYRHKTQLPYKKNKKLQQTIKAISDETGGTFHNIADSRATGFLIRDPKRPMTKKFQTLPETYQSCIDEAVQAVQSGAMDFETAMKRTLKQLNESGFRRAYWESGYSRRLDSTVRMNILEGLKKLNQQIQAQIGEEIGADAVELSAHDFAAPDHEPIQGRAFTIENFEKLQSNKPFEDIYGNKFGAIRRAIGTWNCKHFIQYVVLAKYKPVWNPQDLDELKARNEQGYTTKDGKHYTMYECTQVQRKYETDIRYAKEGYMMAKSANNKQLMAEYEAKLSRLQREYNAFSKACGLSKKKKRVQVSGFSTS